MLLLLCHRNVILSQAEGTDMVEGCRVRAGRGQGDFHLEGGDECKMGGAASPLRPPPVLT